MTALQMIYEFLEENAADEEEKSQELTIKRLIYNNPCTIVIWSNDTKTVVRCGADEPFDEAVGLAMCYMKKLYGSHSAFKKFIQRNASRQATGD